MTSESTLAFTLKELEVFLFRAPADPPVQTSFGVMRDRPALLVRVTDAGGVAGWGEVWCNFPTVGAEHRARLLLAYLRPLLLGRPEWESPAACFEHLTARLAVLAIQSGEQGPLQQVVAGVDLALWDMVARRARLALWKLLGGQSARIKVYASGINPTDPEKLAEAKLREGYRAFKLKVGFGAERDERNLCALREMIGAATPLMVDANQAWDLDEARSAGQRMAGHDLLWLEEPMRADSSIAQWEELARSQPLTLAGGENLAGHAQFDEAIASKGLAILQPDLGKWGGLSGCLEVARRTLAQGKQLCPHWLGAGIGLAASMHFKAAIGGTGYVEVDANPNPLRELTALPRFVVDEGEVLLSDRPGLGVEPDLEACRHYAVEIPRVGL
jgi:D-galactarolactone cycloisomerase